MDRQNYDILERLNAGVLDFVMPLPLPEVVMDVFQLTGGRSDLAVNFLEDLLLDRLSQVLPDDFQTAKWSFEQSVELQNRIRLYGGHWLWIGFPLLQLEDEEQAVLAPLWLWPVSLKPPDESGKGWLLEPAEYADPQPNPRLDSLLREKLGWQGALSWWESFRHRKLDMTGLSELVTELIDKMEIESSSQSISISPWSSAQLMSAEPGNKLLWAGLLGIFPPAYPSELQKKESSPAIVPVPLSAHPFGLLTRDPWQETAFQLAQMNKGTLIQGAAGSGKSALLKDMLVNALSNGKRCLVLSDRMEVLRRLQQELIETGLEKVVVLFHQLKEEPDLILQLLKSAAQDKKKTTFAGHTFNGRLQTLVEQKSLLDTDYRTANKKIFGPNTWTQVTGMYLAAARLESKALLASRLNIQDFDFGYERYQALHDQLAYSQALFEQIKTLNHPLAVLNAGIFVHQEQEEARSFIFSKIEEFSEAGSTLQHRFMLEQNDYGDRLVERYEAFYQEVLDRIMRLQDKISSYRSRFGRDPLESRRTTLQLYARVSKKFKQTLSAKEDLADRYRDLESTLQEQPYFHHDFLPLGERHILGNLNRNLEQLQHQLKSWREQLGNSVQEELSRLSSKTVNTGLGNHGMISELETDLDLLVERFNDSGLLQLPMENKNLTLPKRQRFLEEIMEKLDRLRFDMRDFDRFYEWQRYWFGLPAAARRIITALVKVKPDDWPAAFASWFLHHQLLQSADPQLPESTVPKLSSYVENLQQLRQQLTDQILDYWADRRMEVLQQLKKDQKARYDQLLSKRDQGSAPELDTFTALISHFFPVLLASPYNDYACLAPDEPYDYLLVDEGHQIDTGLLEIWSKRARQVMVFQNPALGSSELSNWARRQVWPQVSLEGNYDSPVTDFQVEAVDGRYNVRQGINDEEARTILDLLNTIEEKPQRTLPKVGIVCLTRGQRNLIVQYLYRIKRQRLAGVEKVQQLERNGLRVYVPEELHGVQLDLMLLSCTFGRTGTADQLTLDIQELDRQCRPGMVELLRTRPRHGLHLVHSIPEEDLHRLAGNRSGANTAELARWLLTRNADQGVSSEKGEADPVHPLATEIAWYIADRVRTDRLAFAVPFGQIKLPLTVAPLRGTQRLAILLNNYLSEHPATSYEWEYNQRMALESAGYRIYPVWAVNWWKRPEQEAIQLSELVNQNFEEEE